MRQIFPRVPSSRSSQRFSQVQQVVKLLNLLTSWHALTFRVGQFKTGEYSEVLAFYRSLEFLISHTHYTHCESIVSLYLADAALRSQ